MFQGQFLEESLNTATVLRKKKKKVYCFELY